MKRYTELLDKRMLEISQEYEQDCVLEEVSLHDKTMRIPGLKSKWLKIYYEEQKLLSVLEDKKQKIEDEVAMKFKKDGQVLALHILKHKMQEYTENDEKLQKLVISIKSQKDIVRFVRELVDIIKTIGFDVKNCINILELESR